MAGPFEVVEVVEVDEEVDEMVAPIENEELFA